jgi:hypothetical protein
MTKFVLAFVLLGLFAPSPSPARGEAALAIGIPKEGLRDGFAYAWEVRAKNYAEAERKALQGCQDQARNYGVSPSRCKVVETFKGRCVSVAFDSGERWAGWAVAADSKAAVAAALQKCGEGAKNCKTHATDCDR